MEISAINHNRYNVATKSQYDAYPATTAQSYPMYVEEEPKSKSNLGMVALGVLGAAGVIYGVMKHTNSKAVVEALEKTKTELEEKTAQLTKEIERADAAEKGKELVEKELEALKNPAKKKFKINLKFWTWFKSKKA